MWRLLIMGFNYLQTDDRDDYFSQFSRANKRRNTGITLTSPDGEIIFDNVRMYKVRAYCKNKYLPIGKGGKRIWRDILLSKGYAVTTCFE